MALTILLVAYPFAPVSLDASGGAEQVLAQLDAALVAAGHRSLVIACEGSRVAGRLITVPRLSAGLDGPAAGRARRRHLSALRRALAPSSVDLVHMHGIDFAGYLPPPGVPALVTLHGPRAWYSDAALAPERPATFFNCVSASQQAEFGDGPRFVEPIENGVPVEALEARHAKRRFALTLGRIAPEKGIHVALQAAHRSGTPLLVAGELFDYAEHRRYFAKEIVPRLDARRRYVGPLGFARKRRFLTAARAVLLAPQAAETSSLVAREALACGTPVITLKRGALPEAIEHGRTGFLVDDETAMAAALGEVGRIDPRECRAVARERFGLARTVQRYLDLYHRLARGTLERRLA